jgi:hypothetical protein
MKPRYWIGILIITIMAVFTFSSCGGGTETSGDALSNGMASVNFSVRLAGAPSAPKALTTKSSEGENEGEDSPQASDDAGTAIALTEVRANIREVEFYLPEGVTCEELQFTFIDPVRCDNDDENDADDLEEEAEDDDSKLAENSSDDGENEDDAEENDEEDKIVVEGPFVVDMIAGTSTPSLTNFLIPAGLYTRIDIKLHKAEDGETLPADDPLNGHSLVATGTFEYQGELHTLHLRLKFTEEIRFKDPAGIEVAETGANDVVVSLDETTWFRGINLVACLDAGDLTLAADGSLTIDDNSGENGCGEIENIIKDNIEASGNVVDENDDEDEDEAENEEEDEPDDDGTPDQGPGDL